MVDVVLVAPMDHSDLRERLGLKAPPLNLLYIAATLRENGLSVQIIDDNVLQLGARAIARSIKKGTKLVGLTAATSTIGSAVRYADAIKLRDLGVTTVIGGPHITFVPQETMERGRSVDIAVIGEGEDTMTDIAMAIEEGKAPQGIKGTAYHDGEKVIINEPREMRQDIDSFPMPARDLVDLNDYKDPVKKRPIGTMITSRGCVFDCAYCASSRMMGQRFRARDPSSIVDEMEVLMSHGIEDVEFIDDIFVLNKKRAIEVAKEIKKRGLDVNFSASSRVDTLSGPMLRELKDAGLTSLYLGIESGSQRVLDLMSKGTTVNQSLDAVRSAHELGIKVLGSFILGYPGETLKEMDETIAVASRSKIDFAQFSLLTPYPGTPIFDQLRTRGLISTDDYDHYTAAEPVIDYDKLGISKKAISRKLAMAYIRFYLRPSYVINHPYMLSMIPRAIFPKGPKNVRG